MHFPIGETAPKHVPRILPASVCATGAARSGMPMRGVRPPGQKTWKASPSTQAEIHAAAPLITPAGYSRSEPVGYPAGPSRGTHAPKAVKAPPRTPHFAPVRLYFRRKQKKPQKKGKKEEKPQKRYTISSSLTKYLP